MMMDIEMIDINDLTPYVNNPRNNDNSVEQVKESIKNFGFKVPIVIDKYNILISGHTRLRAATELGMEKVPVIRANDLTPEQTAAFRLADNRVAENATWDEEKLVAELEELKQMNIDLSITGFDETELEEMLNLGIEMDSDQFGDEFELPDGDRSDIRQKTFTLHENQLHFIEAAMDKMKAIKDEDDMETFGNSNKNGNLLYEVVKEWAEQKR